ncbi:MAG: DUF6134 family protein [Gammaproteobacteria bacterium]
MNRSLYFLLLCLVSLPIFSASKTLPNRWDFKVYLDDKPIGTHRFTLTGKPEERLVHSEARFNVKFLMIDAYRYVHEAEEIWSGDCLTELKAETNDDGELTEIQGGRKEAYFQLVTNLKQEKLPECVWTFAYWHPDLINQKKLLNPQTGEYLPVRTSFQGEEKIKAQGEELKARHYLLDAGKFQIELWYASVDQRWLALDSILEGGRRLRYRIE